MNIYIHIVPPFQDETLPIPIPDQTPSTEYLVHILFRSFLPKSQISILAIRKLPKQNKTLTFSTLSRLMYLLTTSSEAQIK